MLKIKMCPQVPSPQVRIVFFKFNHMEKFISGYYQNYKPVFSLEGLMLKLQYFGHMMKRADSLERTLMLGKTEDRKRRE